jgi:hypothetical protein
VQYRKKPVVVEAMRFHGQSDDPAVEWCGGYYDDNGDGRGRGWVEISTLEGVMRAEVGDYIICGVKGEFYPCKPDVFEATYEPVGSTS